MNITTNGYMEMYGTTVGWYYYNQMVDFLVETGLIMLVPTIMLIVAWKNAETGEDALAGCAKAVQQVKVHTISLLVFITFMFLPYVTISPSQIEYQVEGGEVVNMTNNDSTFSGRFDQNAFENVRTPIGWALIMQVSGGMNTYLLSKFPEVRGLREEIMSVKEVNINNPVLRKEVNRFHDECYSKALHYMTKEEAQIDPVVGVDISPNDFWPGSEKVLEVYGQFNACTENCPPIFRASKPVAGFPVDPRFDVEPEFTDGGEVFGRPLCSAWWNDKLKDAIYGDAALSGVSLDGLDVIRDMFGMNDEKARDLIVYKAMTNKQDIRVSNPNMQYADYDRFTGGHLQGGIANIGLKYEAAKTSSSVYTSVRALPIIQGLILMMLFISLAFLKLLGKFNWSNFLKVLVLYLTVKLWPVWWHLARWIDEFFIGSSIPFSDDETGVFTGFDGAVLDRALLDFILIFSYFVLPLVISYLIGLVGFSQIDRISMTSNSSATSTGRGAQSVTDAGIRGAVSKVTR